MLFFPPLERAEGRECRCLCLFLCLSPILGCLVNETSQRVKGQDVFPLAGIPCGSPVRHPGLSHHVASGAVYSGGVCARGGIRPTRTNPGLTARWQSVLGNTGCSDHWMAESVRGLLGLLCS